MRSYVSSTGGAITLDDTGNAFNTLTVSTTASYDATIYDHSAVTVASANVGGTFTLTSEGAIGQSGAIIRRCAGCHPPLAARSRSTTPATPSTR